MFSSKEKTTGARQDTEGPLLHHGKQQMAVVRYMAAGGRKASYVLFGQRRTRQFA